MTKLSLVLALAALGLGGYVAYDTCCQTQRMEDMEQSVRDVSDSVADLNAKLDHALASAGRAEPAMLAAEGGGHAVGGGHAETGTEPALATREPASPAERLAALERTVAEQKETIAGLKEKADKQPTAPQVASRFFGKNNAFYHNLDAASSALELSERQKADMQDAIDLAKRELKDLYNTENDDGETWNDIRKGKMTTIGGAESGITIAMPDFRKIAKFKKGKIPGTSESFGQAEQRIRKDAFADMRRGLTPDQSKKWDEAHKDQLLGPSSSRTVFSTVSIGSDDK